MRRVATATVAGAAAGAAASAATAGARAAARRPGVATRARGAISRVVEQVKDTAAAVGIGASTDDRNTGGGATSGYGTSSSGTSGMGTSGSGTSGAYRGGRDDDDDELL